MIRNPDVHNQIRKAAPDGDAATDPQSLSIEALRFFGGHPDELQRFFDWSGLDAQGLRSSVADPGFADGLLAYFSQNLISLERFCEAASIRPASVLRLQESLKVRGLSSHDEL